MPAEGRQQGKVRFWNVARGYGFAVPDDGGEDIFVHITNLVDGIDELQRDQRVEFGVRPSSKNDRRFEAVGVKVV